jgi:hypothetical protein
MRHVTVSSKVLTCEMERQQSRGMTVVTRFCKASPVWFQYAGIPHPARGREGCIRERKPMRQSLFRLSPDTGPWEVYAHGGWADGEGAKSPLPCLSAINMVIEGAKRGKHP